MAESTVVVRVVRSGGFAGLRREWRAEGEQDEWMPLVDACDWRSVRPDPSARDRYLWRIEVRAPRVRRKADVPDGTLVGPWRELVDRVQQAGEPTRPQPSEGVSD